MKARIEDYNKISGMVLRQRSLIARSTSIPEVLYNVTMASGFLHGLALTGVIYLSDVESYMNDLKELADGRCKQLEAIS